MAQTLHLKCKTLIRPTKLKITEAFQGVEATGDMAPKIGYNALRKYRQSRGGGGVLNKVLYRKAPTRGPTPYPFIHNFS